MSDMQKRVIILIVIVTAICFVYMIPTTTSRPPQQVVYPSDILGFHPVYEGSPPILVRAAQAELNRHGINVEIDGKCGKQTALGICGLLHKIELGYEIRSMYEPPAVMAEEIRHDIGQGIKKIDKTVQRIREFQAKHEKVTNR